MAGRAMRRASKVSADGRTDDLDRRLDELRMAVGAQPETWVEPSALFEPRDRSRSIM
jgi:hypothetical protein